MADGKRLGKGERTKRAMADALEELVGQMPLDKIRVRTVTERVGVDRQTFYYHFDTMADLARYLYNCRMEAMREQLPACDDAGSLFLLVAGAVEENRELLAALLDGVGRQPMRALLQDDAFAVLFAQARAMCEAQGIDAAEDDLRFAAEFCLLASASLFVDWLEGRRAGTAEDVARDAARAFECHICGLMAQSRQLVA